MLLVGRLATSSRRLAPLALSMMVLASACGSDGGGIVEPAEPGPSEPVVVVDDAARTVDEVVAPIDVEPSFDLEGVVAAALLIASGGDLDAAISAGLVTEADAEAALDALERGSLDRILEG